MIALLRQHQFPALLQVTLGQALCIEVLHPLRHIVHVPIAGAEVAVSAFEEPVGRITGASDRKDRAAVLHGHADGLGATCADALELIGQRTAQEVERRALSLVSCRTDPDGGIVLHAVITQVPLAIIHVVGHDPVVHGSCSRVHAGMAGCGLCGHIVEMSVPLESTFLHESLESAGTEVVPEPVDVVHAHLIHDDAHHELRRSCPGRILLGPCLHGKRCRLRWWCLGWYRRRLCGTGALVHLRHRKALHEQEKNGQQYRSHAERAKRVKRRMPAPTLIAMLATACP